MTGEVHVVTAVNSSDSVYEAKEPPMKGETDEPVCCNETVTGHQDKVVAVDVDCTLGGMFAPSPVDTVTGNDRDALGLVVMLFKDPFGPNILCTVCSTDDSPRKALKLVVAPIGMDPGIEVGGRDTRGLISTLLTDGIAVLVATEA